MNAAGSPSRILVVRTDRIGDVILSLPVMAALRRSFPDSRLFMMVNEKVGEIVTDHPDIDRVLFSGSLKGIGGIRSLVRTIRKADPDTALLLHPTFMLALSLFLAGVPVRMGTAYRWYSFLFNNRIREHRKTSEKHEAEYNLTFAERLGASARPVEFHYRIPPGAVERVGELFRRKGIPETRPRVVIHPGTLGSALEWPPDRFAAVADRLVRERDATVLVTGSREDAATVHRMIEAAREEVWNVSGELGLGELAALIDGADLLIVNSTGPLHMAVALGTEVIGLFPPFRSASWKRWGPFDRERSVLVPELDCGSCSKESCRRWNCMERITVSEVWDLANEKLDMLRVERR